MNLHEFQAKTLLGARGLPLPPGGVATTSQEAATVARALNAESGAESWVVKAQIHAGGRGRSRGVSIVKSLDAVGSEAGRMLGMRLVTEQTGDAGRPVRRVYVERTCEVERELYLALLVDRGAGRVAVMASAGGGADIEEHTASAPESMFKFTVNPDQGVGAGDLQSLCAALNLEGAQADAAGKIVGNLYDAFVELDASLIEINPLAVTPQGDLVALDVKMILDDNALFRHPELEELRDTDETDPSELEARRFELNYVRMDGDIGIMVTGAGLALAAYDMISELGGAPADFMDVRPVATREQVATGVKILLGNQKVRAILVIAMGGGILRCDLVAEGVALAMKETGSKTPLVVRFAGTAKEMGELCLRNQGIPAIFADDLEDAARKAVAAAAGRTA